MNKSSISAKTEHSIGPLRILASLLIGIARALREPPKSAVKVRSSAETPC
jgi:hypothetical protein